MSHLGNNIVYGFRTFNNLG